MEGPCQGCQGCKDKAGAPMNDSSLVAVALICAALLVACLIISWRWGGHGHATDAG